MSLEALFHSGQWSLPLIISGLASVVVAWIKFRNGNLLFSQSRTARLYLLMQDPVKIRKVSSGALQQAVKDMIHTELAGDVIRYALQRDNPLPMLRDFKRTRGLVRLRKGCILEDMRKQPWLNYRAKSIVMMSLALASYAIPSIILSLTSKLGTGAIACYFFAEFILLPLFLTIGVRADSANRLLDESTYPLPAFMHNGVSG